MQRYYVIAFVILALFTLGITLGTAHASATASIRIAQLRIKQDQLAAFTEAVKEEMEAALRVEPGVVAIYAAADTHDPTRLTFFEMYVDKEAYQHHRETPHFQKYLTITNTMIAERVLLEAVPVELCDKYNTPAEYSNASPQVQVSSIRIAQLQIKQDQLAAFTGAVKEEMEAALRVEPGVVAIYAAADKHDPTRLTFFEMYVDEGAYQLHRETPHFQKYLTITNAMIAERVLLEAVPVELCDKYNTPAAK